MKLMLGIFFLAAVMFPLKPAQSFLSRYRCVEAYEVRPDIFATPTYAQNGLLCKVAVEKHHVQADLLDMSPTIPREVAMEIIDELAPPSERGPRSRKASPFDYDIIEGSVAVLPIDYDNVSIRIYRNRSEHGDTAIVLTWNKNCSNRVLKKPTLR